MRKSILACVAVALIVGTTSATAATLVTGKQIKDGSITGQDIKKGSINAARLTEGLQDKIDDQGASGPAGPAGAKGDTGAAGAKGDKGDTGAAGAAGANGAKGDTGAAGAKGDTGAAGAPGAPGAKGDKGDKGDKGEDGVVNVIYDGDTPTATTAAVQADFSDRKTGTLIRDLTLEPGSYEIEAAMSVRGPADGTPGDSPIARVRCNLVDATTTDTNKDRLDTFFQDFFRPDNDSPGFREGLHIGALVTFTVPTKVELRCYTFRPDSGAGAGSIPSSKIVATEVANITQGS